MIAKFLTAAAVLAGLATPAFADLDHSTIMGCYASVHAQCYGDNSPGCSDESYQGGLDECDSSYGNTAEVRPGRTGSFATPTSRAGLGFIVTPIFSNR